MKTRAKRLQSPICRLRSSVCGLRSAVSPSRNPQSAIRNPHSQGFTLIEIMMVVLVILLLSGMLFRLGTIIKDRSERAKATADLSNIENALNEYFAEYGIYPPVTTTPYMYENTSLQPPSMQDPNLIIPEDKLYTYGLVSHLYKRARGSQRRPYNRDTTRDVAAKDRWAHYLADVNLTGGPASNKLDSGEGVQIYSNSVLSIYDPWGREYKYESRPPHLSYRLWSASPQMQ